MTDFLLLGCCYVVARSCHVSKAQCKSVWYFCYKSKLKKPLIMRSLSK